MSRHARATLKTKLRPIAAGLDNTIAVPAVFFYRLFTFWVPILPGWIAFQRLEAKEYI